MRRAGLIGLGGAAGAVLRHLATAAGNPWSVTLLVNVVGAFALGVLAARLARGTRAGDVLGPLAGIGFLGALTTFSTFAVLVADLPPMTALGYALATVVLGVGAAGAGLAVGRRP